MKALVRLFFGLAAAFLGACGEQDARSFLVENAIFEAIYLDRLDLGPEKDSPESRAKVADGLSAICKGDTSGARRLIREAGIGPQIYRLALIAAKAARNNCDYAAWPEKRVLLGDRFKQLVGSGDAAAVLLAALIDGNLAEADRLQVVKALSDKRYGHAEAIYAGTLLNTGDYGKALELLDDAAKQGVMPAYALLARMHAEGLGMPKDPGKACKYLRDAAAGGVESARQQLDGERCK